MQRRRVRGGRVTRSVESLRVVTPIGINESWRLPGSGAGPSRDRLFLGSEGTLGIITEAWMRIQERPSHRLSTSVTFADGAQAIAAVRTIAQSGLHPANCRLLDPGEADATSPSADNDDPTTRDTAAEAWRSTFLRMPYLRDGMARMSAIVETFETATTWDRVEALYHDVNTQIGEVIRTVTGTPGLINCRFTHVYPDGAAPYFTVIAARRRGSEVAMWDVIKAASMAVLTKHRATVTHHHAVGRDHRPGHDRQRPEPFAAAFMAAKGALDPTGILNPGVLVDPRR